MRDRHGLGLRIGTAHVLYRETLTRRVEIAATHKQQGRDGYEFARVRIIFEPRPGASFEARIDGIPPDLVAGVARGLESARRAGALAGFPIFDVAATLVDGAWHATDSSPATFEAAALLAFRLAEGEVGVLLEPIMQVEATMPEPHLGAVRGDLFARRGEIAGTMPREVGLVALAVAMPLANLLGYPASLRTMTQGIGTMTMRFSHFAPVDPPEPPRFPAAAAMRVA